MIKIGKYIMAISLIACLLFTGCSTRKEVLDKEEVDFHSFFNLQESIVENDMQVEKDYEDVYPYLNVKGKHDLNSDGKEDIIEIKLIGREESVVKVNESEIFLDVDTPSDFHLVDLIKDDGFIELAIYDDGPSADPETTFLRYDGKELHELGSFPNDIDLEDSIYSYSGNVLTDGKGNFIPSGSMAKFVTPNIIMGYYYLENNKFTYNPVDYSGSLGKEYSIVEDVEAFFIEQEISKDLTSQDIDFRWDFEKIMEFKKGGKIKIIIHDEFWYGVELEDGTTGILYFWIGD